MAIISTEAVVLRSLPLRETSRIGFFFTRSHGLVKGVLKGIRRDPRKFATSLEPLSINDLVFYQYRHSDIHLISHCDMKAHFPGVRSAIVRINAAAYACELVNKVMPVEQPNEPVYDLLTAYARALEHARDPGRVVHMFQIKLLTLSGFRPHIDSCVSCARPVEGRASFSTVRGGLICPACRGRGGDLMPVTPGAIASLLYVEHHTWEQCLKLSLAAAVRRELRHILNNFLIHHLGKRIRASRFLD